MAYSINPCLPKARRQAVLLVVKDRAAVATVARRFGVNRSTVYRWLKRWQEVNAHRDNNWRAGLRGLNYYKFLIPTKSSRPHTSPSSLPGWIVERVLALKQQLKRCAEVVWHYLVLEGIKISLSSVRRILARFHYCDRPKHKKKLYRRNIKRPLPNKPGDLVQVDTVHLVDPNTGTRKYIVTVIDLYTRLAYAKVYDRLYQLPALETILIAEQRLKQRFGFTFRVVQSDNGPEFGKVFKQRLEASSQRLVRHTRPHRPNDNAHIERFNRTLRQECVGQYMSSHYTVEQVQRKLDTFLDYYNNDRVHLSLQCKTPAEFCSNVLQRT